MGVAPVAALGLIALTAFAWQERRHPDPLLPFEIFRSRQFSAANAVTFVVYAGLGGFFFLFVSFLQVSLGYSPVEAGAASLPVTAVMLMFSAWSGGLTERLGARLPLALGSLIIGAAMLAMTTMSPGDDYLTGVLPPVLLFGVGLTLVVAPGTAVALGSADASRAGIASGINNAVARVAGLLAVAGLPVLVGITGDRFYEPAMMRSGFHAAMTVCAALAAAGGILAWCTITGPLSTLPSPIDRELPLGEQFGCPISEPNVCSGPVGPSREPGADGPGPPWLTARRPSTALTPYASGVRERQNGALPRCLSPSSSCDGAAIMSAEPLAEAREEGAAAHLPRGRRLDAAARTDRARDRMAKLSPREHDVALAVARGQANAEIAAALHLSVPTVKAHVSRLLGKLDVNNRVQIALLVKDASGHQ